MMVLFLLLLIAVTPACSSAGSEPAPTAPTEAASVLVDASRIEMRELQRTVDAIGTLDPNEEVTVSNQVDGLVKRVFVDLGDAVRAGQALAELDASELELAVHQQRAALQQEMARLGLTDADADVDESTTSQVRQAEATFAEARIRLDRVKALVNEGVVAKQQLDEQQARYDVAEAALRSARESVRNIRATIAARKASLALAEKKLADARITAPLSGFVKERLVAEGSFLRANSPVMTLVQNSPLKLRVEVPETAIDAVRVNGSVQFSVDSYPDQIFKGRISRIAPSVNQQSRTLELEALVDNTGGALKPGLFARVTILTDRRDQALVAPSAALFTFAGIEKLFLIEGGKVVERIVRSGARTEEYVEIVEGVKEGDIVATSNLGNLQQGREASVR